MYLLYLCIIYICDYVSFMDVTIYRLCFSLLRKKRETDLEFVQFCKLRRGAARHSIDSLLLLPVSTKLYLSWLSECHFFHFCNFCFHFYPASLMIFYFVHRMNNMPFFKYDDYVDSDRKKLSIPGLCDRLYDPPFFIRSVLVVRTDRFLSVCDRSFKTSFQLGISSLKTSIQRYLALHCRRRGEPL